jgi:hypothetical protein
MNQEDSDSDEFVKIAELEPDLHHVNIIAKVFQIESVIVLDHMVTLFDDA